MKSIGVFTWPLLIFVSSMAGLLLALISEGADDLLALIMLSVPLVAVIIGWIRR
jgi:hypothetical protein